MLKEMYIRAHLVADAINSRPGVCQSVCAAGYEIQSTELCRNLKEGIIVLTPVWLLILLWEPKRDPGCGLCSFSFFWIQGAFPLFPCTGALMEDS